MSVALSTSVVLFFKVWGGNIFSVHALSWQAAKKKKNRINLSCK